MKIWHAVVWSRQQDKFIVVEHEGYNTRSEEADYWCGNAEMFTGDKLLAEMKCCELNTALTAKRTGHPVKYLA